MTKINFKGKKGGTLALVATHKKEKSVLRIYNLQHRAHSYEPLPSSSYRKKDALVELEFDNREALEVLMTFLVSMHKEHLRREIPAATVAAMMLEELLTMEESPVGFHEVGIEQMPDDVLKPLMSIIGKEAKRRGILTVYTDDDSITGEWKDEAIELKGKFTRETLEALLKKHPVTTE